MKRKYPKAFLDVLKNVEAKRPRTVIQHILTHGFITSQDLKDLYGYNHPPRAVRDVREYGIPVVTYRVEGTDGRKIAAYKFGDPKEVKNTLSKASGRTALSKALKQALVVHINRPPACRMPFPFPYRILDISFCLSPCESGFIPHSAIPVLPAYHKRFY